MFCFPAEHLTAHNSIRFVLVLKLYQLYVLLPIMERSRHLLCACKRTTHGPLDPHYRTLAGWRSGGEEAMVKDDPHALIN